MKSPQDMRIIQIDITNACIHSCSNCTRFCGHKKPFYMTFETFKKAIDSFEGYVGTVGIIGGEPTLHPEFSRFLEYMQEHRYYKKTDNLLLKPAKNLMNVVGLMEQRNSYVNEGNGIKRNCVNGFGLWSAYGKKYRDYYELIQDTFDFQALNDHTNIMYHSPIFIRRKDLKITDEEWVNIRDNCWAQREWSATITPKGAFFCEIAGALDMLFDGPGGWPIEPGWWKRKPNEFGDQLKWCELCGIAFAKFTRNANDRIDDMSPWYYSQLKKMNSPKIKSNLYNILSIDNNGVIDFKSIEGAKEEKKYRYYDNYFDRYSEKNNFLNPERIIGVLIEDDLLNKENINKKAHELEEQLDLLIIFTHDEELFNELENQVKSDKIQVLFENYKTLGACLNKLIVNSKNSDLFVLLDSQVQLNKDFNCFLKQYTFNPGVVLYSQSISSDDTKILGTGIRAIFSPIASSIKKATYPIVREITSIEDFFKLFPTEKKIALSLDTFKDYQYEIEPNIKYALYGIGSLACKDICQLEPEQIVFCCDSDPSKWGGDFNGHTILSPKELLENKKQFDKILVTSGNFIEIKSSLTTLGFDSSIIVTLHVIL